MLTEHAEAVQGGLCGSIDNAPRSQRLLAVDFCQMFRGLIIDKKIDTIEACSPLAAGSI